MKPLVGKSVICQSNSRNANQPPTCQSAYLLISSGESSLIRMEFDDISLNGSDSDAFEEESSSEEEGSSSEEEEPYWTTGVDLEIGESDGTLDTVEDGILDLMATKMSAIRLASESARTVLSVDQIIVSRQAGGPKPPQGGGDWDQD